MVKTVTQSEGKRNVKLCEVHMLNLCIVKRVETSNKNVGVYYFSKPSHVSCSHYRIPQPPTARHTAGHVSQGYELLYTAAAQAHVY